MILFSPYRVLTVSSEMASTTHFIVPLDLLGTSLNISSMSQTVAVESHHSDGAVGVGGEVAASYKSIFK